MAHSNLGVSFPYKYRLETYAQAAARHGLAAREVDGAGRWACEYLCFKLGYRFRPKKSVLRLHSPKTDSVSTETDIFEAVENRIGYLRDMGVTTVEFMPFYEFEELMIPETCELPDYVTWKEEQKTLKI